MEKITPELESVLGTVAKDFGMSLDRLYWIIQMQQNYLCDKEDIRAIIREESEWNTWLIGKDEDEEFVNAVYLRFDLTQNDDSSKDFLIREAIRWIAEGYDD